MYFIVVTDDRFKCNIAVTLDALDSVRVALQVFSSEHGYRTMVFKFNPETELYYEIYPEDLDYDN